MNAAYLHLLLNHVPTVGGVVALGLLIAAAVRRHDALAHAALELLVVVAIVALPAYTTGTAAQLALRDRPDVSSLAVRAHQDAALAGFAVLEVAGFLAWIALWRSRRQRRVRPASVAATMLVLVAALALLARAATLGGAIRHPEIRPAGTVAAPVTADPGWPFVAAAISSFMVSSRWAWPAAEAVHFLGLSLSLGVLLAVNLRILGAMRGVPFAALHRLLPWAMLGLGANLATGMLFFIAQPGQYVDSPPFLWKLVFLMIAAANFLYLTVFEKPWARDGFEASAADKALAVCSLAAWLGVLYAGRMLPFIGRAF
ncbi:MAG TPA: hypothetical protein VNI78_05700 [Vicinamibacterales bacterium]|nr:hypothetical protein [Vicinamibacterales bacterium]